MASDKTQKKAWQFFSKYLLSQDIFTKDDLKTVTSWEKNSTLNTYWTKHFKPFVIEVSKGRFRVSESFRPYNNWKKFQRHVTQVRLVAADYKHLIYDDVIIYEFFMPLTNETRLRMTLDALFYKETIMSKLRAIGIGELQKHFAVKNDRADEAYLDRICEWIDSKFGGYSVYHVDGRFRGVKLSTQEQAADIQKTGQRYLVDETTAVTRFIFPCKDLEEAELVRYFFDELFVRSIIQLINAEDEIWMVESGMKNRIHIWRVE